VVTEPVLELPNIQDAYDEIIFEDFGFPSYLRKTGKHPHYSPLPLP